MSITSKSLVFTSNADGARFEAQVSSDEEGALIVIGDNNYGVQLNAFEVDQLVAFLLDVEPYNNA